MDNFFDIPKTTREDKKRHGKISVGPIQLSFDITNNCNLRCLHCFNSSGEVGNIGNELSDNEAMKIIQEIAEMKLYNFCFCGGEPLLRKELIIEASKILSKNGVNVSLVSNGWFINEDIAKDLFRSGLKRVQISLDGSTPDSHDKLRGKKGVFNRAIQAIKILKKIGMENVSISFCPTNFNYFEIFNVYKMCMEYKINDLRIQPLMVIGRCTESIKMSYMMYRKLVRDIIRLNKGGINSTHFKLIEWGDPIDHLIRFRSRFDHFVTFVGIRADGSIQVSPYLPIVVGNLRIHTLKEYWSAGLYKIWQLERIKYIAKQMNCVKKMRNKLIDQNNSKIEEIVRFDLINDNIFN